jgi:hypothetical protein
MEWLNLHSSVLDSPEVVGAEPVDRATWLFLLRYCIGQENGGLIADCAEWGDRRWQQVVRVTRDEIQRQTPLWKFSSGGLNVNFYPIERQKEIEAKRKAGKDTVAKRWGKQSRSVNSSAIRLAHTEGEGEGERKDKGKEKGKEKEECAAAPLPFSSSEFSEAWNEFTQHRKEKRKPLTPTSTKGALRMLGELGERRAIIAIRHTVAMGWQGLREPERSDITAKTEPDPRTYGGAEELRIRKEKREREEAEGRAKQLFAAELENFGKHSS